MRTLEPLGLLLVSFSDDVKINVMLVQGVEENGNWINNAKGVRKALLLCSGLGQGDFLMAHLLLQQSSLLLGTGCF